MIDQNYPFEQNICTRTFWVVGVAMEIPIPEPGSTDKTLYCAQDRSIK